MTRIVVKRDDLFGCTKLVVSGHSGYSEEGTDIICAYVSASTELLMNILIDQLGADTSTEISHDSPDVSVEILDTENNRAIAASIKAVCNGFTSQMSDISKQFPKFVAITNA